MKFGVIRFPGSCDEVDAQLACQRVGEAVILWHGDHDLQGVDAVVVPGGFSYGDYLRAGAIARFAPVMEQVAEFAAAGGLVLGICNGFQVLCEAGERLSIPVKHMTGCYYAPPAMSDELTARDQILLRYAPGHNPNGSLDDIAGVCNEGRNVFGLMPHPEHAVDPLTGSTDGLEIFTSIAAHLADRVAV